ncbi:MAG: hypothetical protein Kow0047_25150 [Anaerolineae bacterium]
MNLDAAVRELIRLTELSKSGRFVVPEVIAERLSRPQRWHRVRYPLALIEYRLLLSLAVTGWSHRASHAAAATWDIEAQKPRVSEDSGTFRRAYRTLKANGLWAVERIRVGHVLVPLVRLAPAVCFMLRNELGLEPALTEEDLILSLHPGGAHRQRSHTAAICAFTHAARLRGYDTEVCPALSERQWRPDVWVVSPDGVATYVEVQGSGGLPAERIVKWQMQAEYQGYAAICAVTPKSAERYVAEARRVGVRRGLVTDLQTLFSGESALWTHRWDEEGVYGVPDPAERAAV